VRRVKRAQILLAGARGQTDDVPKHASWLNMVEIEIAGCCRSNSIDCRRGTPYLLMLAQDATERILTDRLVVLDGTIHRGVTATRLTQRATGVEVMCDAEAGEQTIGARPMSSAQTACTASSARRSAPSSRVERRKSRASWPTSGCAGRTAVTRCSCFSLPQGWSWSHHFQTAPSGSSATLDDAPEHPAAADIQALINARGPTGGTADVTDVVWSSRFRIHHRLANSYRDGRLFLIGDATHVHSPAGGQGMNTGLVDACVLGQSQGNTQNQNSIGTRGSADPQPNRYSGWPDGSRRSRR
jgi:2-polyprenyl-6-methoxyphenol hydroxylase-like FAD-dependent oxidoreductase